MKPENPSDSRVLTALVSALIVGALTIAIVDPSRRGDFFDLAKVGLGGYCGWVIPRAGR
jgi:hypothetical protein